MTLPVNAVLYQVMAASPIIGPNGEHSLQPVASAPTIEAARHAVQHLKIPHAVILLCVCIETIDHASNIPTIALPTKGNPKGIITP